MFSRQNAYRLDEVISKARVHGSYYRHQNHVFVVKKIKSDNGGLCAGSNWRVNNYSSCCRCVSPPGGSLKQVVWCICFVSPTVTLLHIIISWHGECVGRTLSTTVLELLECVLWVVREVDLFWSPWFYSWSGSHLCILVLKTTANDIQR